MIHQSGVVDVNNHRSSCRVVIIGEGYMSREHIRAFLDAPGVKITGIHSQPRSGVEALARRRCHSWLYCQCSRPLRRSASFRGQQSRHHGNRSNALAEYLSTTAEPTSNGLRNRYTGHRIAAIVTMHAYGHPVNMASLMEVATRYKLAVVEDAVKQCDRLYRVEQGRVTLELSPSAIPLQ